MRNIGSYFALALLALITSIPLWMPISSGASQTTPTETLNPTEIFQTAVQEAVNSTQTATAEAQSQVVITASPSAIDTFCLENEQGTEQSRDLLYDFEQPETEHNWNASEGEFKPDELEITQEVAHCGEASLQISTELDATGEDVYRHTEVTAYFDRAVPVSFNEPGPKDFNGKTVSCFVYVPPDFPHAAGDIALLRLFVKDRRFANQFGEIVEVSEGNLGQWINLSLLVEQGAEGADENFDPTAVNTLGIRIEVPSHSDLQATVTLNIDDCSAQTLSSNVEATAQVSSN
jgi:hypothetical protein